MPASSPTLTLLFIQATPPDLDSLDIASEQRNLVQVLQKARFGGSFRVEWLHAARIQDIADGLRRYRPQIVHFSGHGDSRGHLALNAPDGQETEYLKAAEFAAIVRLYQDEAAARIDLMVLAGCYTAAAGLLTAEHVGCVVAMGDSVNDEGIAQIFTPELYAALADGRSVKNAVESARLALGREHPLDVEAVQIFPDGADAGRLVLTDLAAQRAAQGGLSELHLEYLRRLFEQKWSSVSMALFDPTFGRRLDLLDIYVPLPVEFTINRRLDDRGREKEWWCGRSDEDVRKLEEFEAANRDDWAVGDRQGQRYAGHPYERQRSWAELNVDERGLLPLLAMARAQKTEGEKGFTQWRADAEHAALVQRRFVLVGDPGSGKSTFLRRLALCWAGELRRRAGDLTAPPEASVKLLPGHTDIYTPIYIELRGLVGFFGELPVNPDHAAALPGLAELRVYLCEHMTVRKDETWVDGLFALLRQGQAAILLDGLDEISQAADPRRQAQIQAFVAELVDEFPVAPIIVTARPYAYRQGEWTLPGFGRTELAPLDAARQAGLTHRLFARLLDKQTDAQANAFKAALHDIPADLRSNPLLLTLLAALWVRRSPREKDLPSTRGELYRRALTLLLEDWVRTKVEDFSIAKNLRLSADDLRLVLQLTACHAQERRSKADEVAVITEGDIFESLRAIRLGGVAEGLLAHLEQQAGMLLEAVEEGPGVLVATYTKQFRFLHLSFQEYLTACELLHRLDDSRAHGLPVLSARRFPDGLANRMIAAPELWANVLRLAVDELIYQRRATDAWELLSLVCEPYSMKGDAPQAAWLALQTALEAGLFAHKPEHRVDSFHHLLCSAADKALLDHKTFSPVQRQVAGHLLGSGPFPGHDPRPGVLLRPDGLPDIAWVLIPKIDPQTGKSDWIYQDGKRQPEPDFWIARYPITYAQFQAFLDAPDGFGRAEWWRGLAASQSHRSSPDEQRFQHWNHPRENVSWYDAIAFCRWLTAQARKTPDLLPAALQGSSDWQITLPTEWQWEKAARGHEGREYPWGQGYRSGWANVDETEEKDGPYYLQQTSAVGMYPHTAPDASPYGVADLSGNVWEWCLNEYEKPERVQPEGSEWRVLRGGSWYLNPAAAASAFRNRNNPNNRNNNRGFRVVAVRSSPTSFRPFSGVCCQVRCTSGRRGLPALHSGSGSGNVGCAPMFVVSVSTLSPGRERWLTPYEQLIQPR